MIYLKLFFEFFKTGLFAIGGGMATIPFLEDIGMRTGWFNNETLVNMIAVSESTPGPIGINMATYVGYTTAGILGSIIATLGLITPSIIVILIIATILLEFKNNKNVNNVFYGIRPASTALIASAWISVLTLCLVHVDAFKTNDINSIIDLKNIVLFAIIWILSNKISKTKTLHPLCFIAIAAFVGIIFRF